MKKNYFYPQYSLTIQAESREAADIILDEKLKAENEEIKDPEHETPETEKKQIKKEKNKGIPENVSNK